MVEAYEAGEGMLFCWRRKRGFFLHMRHDGGIG